VLADFYNDVVEAGKPLEIVFVSSDRDEKSMKEYLNDMPWLAVCGHSLDIEVVLIVSLL